MLALLLLPLLASQVASTCWQHNQRNHAFSSLTPRQMSYLASCMAKETSFQPLLEPLLQPRVPGSAGHTAARQHIEAKMRELGWSVELDTFTASTPLGSRTFSNIVATLHPDSPRRLVLAAHYDSKVTPAGFVGAIDSAVPCAMLLHLAASMTSLLRGAVGSVPELSLQLVFFDGEEAFVSWSATDSLYGSRHLASAWANTPYTVRSGEGHCQEGSATQLDRIDSLVLLDLLGAARPTFHRYLQFNTSLYDLASQLEESLGRRACLQGTSMFSGTNKYSMIQDDHLPFFNLGVRQILHMIADPFPAVWHTLQDNRDALDTVTIMQMNKLLRALVFSYLG